MQKRIRLAKLLTLSLVAVSTAAFAQETSEMPAAAEASPSAAPAASEPVAGEPTAAPATEEAPTVAAAAAPKVPEMGHYGVAARWRWVTVPGWFLGLFTQKNVALSTFNCFALEGIWRKHDREDHNRTWEIMVSIGYQNMSPPDGYWLGKGKDITIDTDLVQAKGLGLITMDAAYVLRQYFSPYFGIHYGAGLGLGVVRGKVMRTSAVCDPATGECHVELSQTNASTGKPDVHCGHAGEPACTERDLANSEGLPDRGPNGAQRFQETSVPSALPIINLLFGLDFPVPDAKGLEFHLEGGFYDAFFLGLSAGYVY
jgi:hypothetical protein